LFFFFSVLYTSVSFADLPPGEVGPPEPIASPFPFFSDVESGAFTLLFLLSVCIFSGGLRSLVEVDFEDRYAILFS